MPRRAHRLDANQDVIVNVLCAVPDVSVCSLAGVAAGCPDLPRGDSGRDASGGSQGRREAALASDVHAGSAAVDRAVAGVAGGGAYGRRHGAGLGAAGAMTAITNAERRLSVGKRHAKLYSPVKVIPTRLAEQLAAKTPRTGGEAKQP